MFVLLFPLDSGPIVAFPAYLLTLGLAASVLAFMETGAGNLKLQQALRFYWYNIAPASLVVALVALYSIVTR
jgi:formate hydrogenlyase subunit 4